MAVDITLSSSTLSSPTFPLIDETDETMVELVSKLGVPRPYPRLGEERGLDTIPHKSNNLTSIIVCMAGSSCLEMLHVLWDLS